VTGQEPVVDGSANDLHGEQTIQFHVECYYFWVEANRKRPTRAGNSQATDQNGSQVNGRVPPSAVEDVDAAPVVRVADSSSPEVQ